MHQALEIYFSMCLLTICGSLWYVCMPLCVRACIALSALMELHFTQMTLLILKGKWNLSGDKQACLYFRLESLLAVNTS